MDDHVQLTTEIPANKVAQLSSLALLLSEGASVQPTPGVHRLHTQKRLPAEEGISQAQGAGLSQGQLLY